MSNKYEENHQQECNHKCNEQNVPLPSQKHEHKNKLRN